MSVYCITAGVYWGLPIQQETLYGITFTFKLWLLYKLFSSYICFIFFFLVALPSEDASRQQADEKCTDEYTTTSEVQHSIQAVCKNLSSSNGRDDGKDSAPERSNSRSST